MNLLAVFFKNLIALVIGAVGASLLLICINSAIEWHRGGNLPESEKKIRLKNNKHAAGGK